MELRVLNYFLVVAQEENITRAAEILHTSQSNLSRQLSDLECELGKILFTRGSRRITLTEEGMFLRRRAQEIMELTARTEQELKTFEDQISGTVHLGCIESDAMRLLAAPLRTLRAQYPQIRLDLFSGSIAEITEGLGKGLLDFGILVAPVDMQKYNYRKLPVQDVFGLLMRKDCPLAALPAIRPEDIGDYPVWTAHQQLEGNVLSSWLGRGVNTLNVLAEFNLITTPAMLVAEGLGAAFTFDRLVDTSEHSPLCFRPLTPRVTADLYLVWKKYQTFSRAAAAFLQECQTAWDFPA